MDAEFYVHCPIAATPCKKRSSIYTLRIYPSKPVPLPDGAPSDRCGPFISATEDGDLVEVSEYSGV